MGPAGSAGRRGAPERARGGGGPGPPCRRGTRRRESGHLRIFSTRTIALHGPPAQWEDLAVTQTGPRPTGTERSLRLRPSTWCRRS
eukprot:1373287-Alexandrium_andersonii.AAC.1